MISTNLSQLASKFAFGSATTFLVLLTTLHFLEPEFDPSWRLISEYEIGKYGWMMSIAFYSLGGSLLSLMTSIWSSLTTSGGKIGRWWMLFLSFALIGAGIFVTLPITDITSSTTNNIHSLCGLLVIFTFPVAATLVGSSLTHHSKDTSVHSHLKWILLLVWIGFIAFFVSLIIFKNMNHPGESGFGPEVMIGWPNRFMMLTYCIWIMTVAWFKFKKVK